MKLVRLESDNVLTTSQFTNKLAIPLILGKNAKVALKTLSMDFEAATYIIDNTNNELQYKLQDLDGYTTATIANGGYSANGLVEALQNALNNSMNYTSFDPSTVSFEWKCTLEGDLLNGFKLNILFDRNDPLSVTDAECDLIGGLLFDNSLFYATNPNPNFIGYAPRMFCTHDMCRGGWYSSFVTAHAPNTNDNISDSKWFAYLSVNDSTFDVVDEQGLINNMVCGFGVSDNGTYTYKKNGVMVDTELGVDDGHLLLFYNAGGVIEYIIDTDPNGNHAISEFVGDTINSIYPVLGSSDFNFNININGQENTGNIAFSDVVVFETPFAATVNGIYKPLNTVEDVKRNSNLQADPTNVTLNFNNPNTRILLGFVDDTYSKNLISGTFAAEAALKSSLLENDATVELLELSTGGYDHAYKMNRNIIGVLTSSELKQSISTGVDTYKLSFKEEFQNFINISNFSSTLNVNSLTVRVSAQGQTLPVIGKMSCGLFFTYDED
jgi:hypothetical protein